MADQRINCVTSSMTSDQPDYSVTQTIYPTSTLPVIKSLLEGFTWRILNQINDCQCIDSIHRQSFIMLICDITRFLVFLFVSVLMWGIEKKEGEEIANEHDVDYLSDVMPLFGGCSNSEPQLRMEGSCQ